MPTPLRPEIVWQDGLALITITKGLLVLTPRQFAIALRQGKRWQRQHAYKARQPKESPR